jgi:O-antigen/teichoic acid export membrane protein
MTVGGAVFVYTVANYLWQWMGNVILGLFWSPREVGLYALTFQFAFMLTYVIAAVSSFFAPTVASLLAHGSHRQLETTSNELGLWCGYGNLSIAITLILGAASFLSLFGASFAVTEAQWSLRILVVCFLVYSILGAMPANVLSMGGQHRKSAWIEISMVPLVLLLHMAVSSRLGVVGAASVTGVSLLLVGFLRSVVVRKEFGYWQVRSGNIWRLGSVGIVSLLCATGASLLMRGAPPVASLAAIFITAVSGELMGLWLVREPTAMQLADEMKRRVISRRGLVAEKPPTALK